MILNGLGGTVLSRQHAENSARLANATQPEYLATLVVSFPQGDARFRAGFPEWQACERARTVRRNGALRFGAGIAPHRVPQRPRIQSLVLKGSLGAEKDRLLNEIRAAMASPEAARLRPVWQRGL
jgi:hypothetical protein